MRLRVGLIGLGEVWQVRHAPALRALADRFEVRAVCDQVRHRAELAAAEFHAEAVDGYHALIQREDIDCLRIGSGRCPFWRRANRARPSIVRSAWTSMRARPWRSSIGWKSRASLSWPSSPGVRPRRRSG